MRQLLHALLRPQKKMGDGQALVHHPSLLLGGANEIKNSFGKDMTPG
jgi:hypothetical protein